MPFVTEYNTSRIFKRIIGEIPDDIYEWKPYKKPIYFLNRLDKTNLHYFKKFCENPLGNIDTIYNPIIIADSMDLVYEGACPSYHKFEECERLNSNFTNYKIPKEIKDKGSEEVEKYRKWFKENEKVFIKKPDVYQMRLQAKYGIVESIKTINYRNSGNVYKENLTLNQIETRIDSLLKNAAIYFNADKKRQVVIRKYQTSTFLAFGDKIIEENNTNYSDNELKIILKEYYYLFIQPTIFYLKEFFKTYYNSNIEFDEQILNALNFRKCHLCYNENYKCSSSKVEENKTNLQNRFGDFKFPLEPTKFYFENQPNSEIRIAFIFCRVYRIIDLDFKIDNVGKYKRYMIEFINHNNNFIYRITNVYEEDVDFIELFRRYLTKIEQNIRTKKASYRTYRFEL